MQFSECDIGYAFDWTNPYDYDTIAYRPGYYYGPYAGEEYGMLMNGGFYRREYDVINLRSGKVYVNPENLDKTLTRIVMPQNAYNTIFAVTFTAT